MQRLLYEKAVGLGVVVKLNTRVASIRQSEAGGPEVVCKDDTIISGDLVVGADGLWSRCRESLLGATDHPLPTGDLAYRITLTLDQIKDEDLRKFVSEPTLHFWIGPGTHAVGYNDLPPEVSRRPGSTEEMRVLFDGWDPLLTRMLGCVETVDKWKLMHRAELPSWTNSAKNFVLIGDSCHPMLPYLAQGANSSIEDGAVLGKVLSYVKTRQQLPKAVELFEKLRKSRGEKVARETFHQRHDFHMEDGPEQEERDKIFASQLGKNEPEVKFPSRWNCPEVQPWLYGYDADKEVEAAMKEWPISS
ncbi:hypothetical protein LTR64_004929 [Lithohypha guttulata]|uniref:uncharacterized protein n=1 Tax=Lithohypha guttulata TaxID=1690604 RepID=UPI00315D1A4C